ncbi:Uncharacterized protein dnm_005790 [Desulfonema magnum]|uniref:Uncharacterized protein n=1 Tax=Desulfonema magnum TaxID=45655 RepID=A0A975BGE1_9BACT|nr:Uncharacterized protein dnm_005790 [Desulfonema magnum]
MVTSSVTTQYHKKIDKKKAAAKAQSFTKSLRGSFVSLCLCVFVADFFG